jgi:DNA-binding transcriptional MerR regulator
MQGIEKEEIRFTIGQLAKISGISLSTVRYYQRLGLVNIPERNSTSFRAYYVADLHRLQQIKGAQELGFTLSEIGHLLASVDGDQCGRAVSAIQAKLAETESKAEKLALARTKLKELMSCCGGGCAVGNCRFLHELENFGYGALSHE